MTDSFPLVKGYQLKGHPDLCVGNYGVIAQYMPRKKVFVVKYYKPERESRALKVMKDVSIFDINDWLEDDQELPTSVVTYLDSNERANESSGSTGVAVITIIDGDESDDDDSEDDEDEDEVY